MGAREVGVVELGFAESSTEEVSATKVCITQVPSLMSNMLRSNPQRRIPRRDLGFNDELSFQTSFRVSSASRIPPSRSCAANWSNRKYSASFRRTFFPTLATSSSNNVVLQRRPQDHRR
ncbi:hypothetical protein QOT17_021989 [Balamuthia mandrillaris]